MNALHARPTGLVAIARFGDTVMLAALVCSALAAVGIGLHYGSLALAAGVAAALLAAGGAAFVAARGTALSSMVLTVCNVGAVALHIQLGRGLTEFHFGVFVLLGLLLVYRDWRPVFAAALLFAVHHVLFDRLQAMGFETYCTTAPDLFKVVMHALYVVAQTSIEIFLAVRLHQAAVESSELTTILRDIDRGSALNLDMSHIVVRAPTALLLQQTLTRMAAAMAQVRDAAGSIEDNSTALAAGNVNLSHRTEEQTGNLEQTARAVEALAAAVGNTANTAVQATALAAEAAEAAAGGGAAVRTLIGTMAAIAESSRRIADINTVVDSISFQTNILALNAAVEAARAGEQGRGFAVVATEVRTLAQRSAAAAREIKALISDSVSKVELGARQVGSAGSSMEDIVRQAEQVRVLISEISSAASDQRDGIGRLDSAVGTIDSLNQRNAEMVQAGRGTADSLHQQARQLIAVVERFALAAPAAGGRLALAG